MKVLIAEDDAVSRMILERAVEWFGHECLAAADGLAASRPGSCTEKPPTG